MRTSEAKDTAATREAEEAKPGVGAAGDPSAHGEGGGMAAAANAAVKANVEVKGKVAVGFFAPGEDNSSGNNRGNCSCKCSCSIM